MPLILEGDIKKVISLSSGYVNAYVKDQDVSLTHPRMADNELVTKFGVYEAGPYTVSKSAMNMVVSKFQAEYESNGVLFLSISPGLVDTGIGEECKLIFEAV